MRYKNPEDPKRFTRELRRLFEVEVYDGDPDDEDCPIVVETVIAFNATHAIRACAPMRVAKQPVALFFVTYPPLSDPDKQIYRIDTTAGPTDERVEPTIPNVEEKPKGMFKVESAIVTHHD